MSALALVAVVAAVALLADGADDPRSAVAQAAQVAPAGALTWNVTDWSVVAPEPVEDVDRLAVELSARDLSLRSVVIDSGAALREVLGISVADLATESYTVTPVGDVLALRLRSDRDLDDLDDRLADAGYVERGGQWTAPAATVSALGLPVLATRIQASNVAGRPVVFMGDSAAIELSLATARGQEPSLLDDSTARHTIQALRGSSTILLRSEGLGCSFYGVDSADDRRAASVALKRAGGDLERYGWSGRGLSDPDLRSSRIRQKALIAMTFADSSQARRQARTRAELATGPWIGRSGDVQDSLVLRSARADQATVRLEFTRVDDRLSFMDGDHPELFTSC